MSNPATSRIEHPSNREVIFSRLLDAPRELVWKAWSDPQELHQWWGPQGFTTRTHEFSFVPGGVWRSIMYGPDGTDYPTVIVFREIEPPSRLVYENGWDLPGSPLDFKVVVTFVPEGTKTRLALHMTFNSEEAYTTAVERYGVLHGGTQTLDRLAGYVGVRRMRAIDLERLYDYGYWANRRLLAALAPLRPAQFVESVAGSYGSIRNTLVHAMSAEWGWLERCGGPARGERLKAELYPTIESLAETWAQVERYMRGFLSQLSDADLERRITFALGGGPAHEIALGDLLQHAALHAIHHRGQASLLARELGFAPGDLDFLMYLAEVPARH